MGSPKTPRYLKSVEARPYRLPRQGSPSSHLHKTNRLYTRLGIATAIAFAGFLLILAFKTNAVESPESSLSSHIKIEYGPSISNKHLYYSSNAELTVYSYFSHFEGRQTCSISSHTLYLPPQKVSSDSSYTSVFTPPYCQTRSQLIRALTGGGRHGFDAPFYPRGCHYKWFNTIEICLILSRFDAILFIGDDHMRDLYAGLNILLRENVELGALREWELSNEVRDKCRCGAGFIGDCRNYLVGSSEEVASNSGGSKAKGSGGYGFACNRTPHFFVFSTGSLSDQDASKINSYVAGLPGSTRPIPVIHSVTSSLSPPLSVGAATTSVEQLRALLADASQRNYRKYPYLWVGPTAVGHLLPRAKVLDQGNNARWRFGEEMLHVVKQMGGEAVGVWNATIQAGSWDGSGRGVEWSVTETMMVR